MHSAAGLPSNLILIAGPSAAGKTTFVERLLAGTLPDALQTMFPDRLKEWIRLEGNVFAKRDRSLDTFLSQLAPGQGVIVHYDTLLIHRYGVDRYQDDPVFQLFAEAQALVVVNLVPPLSVLRSQFAARRQHNAHRKGWARRLWGPIQKFARPLRVRMRGKSAAETVDIYRAMDNLEHFYSVWDDFVSGLARRVPGARMVYVTPHASSGDGTFDVIKAG